MRTTYMHKIQVWWASDFSKKVQTSLAPPRGFEWVVCCLLCGPAQGDLDPEPGRASKFSFLRPSLSSLSPESESDESSEARGDIEPRDEVGDEDTGGGRVRGVNKRAAAHWFWAFWTWWAANGVGGAATDFLALTGDFAGLSVSSGSICWAHLEGFRVRGRSDSTIKQDQKNYLMHTGIMSRRNRCNIYYWEIY